MFTLDVKVVAQVLTANQTLLLTLVPLVTFPGEMRPWGGGGLEVGGEFQKEQRGQEMS